MNFDVKNKQGVMNTRITQFQKLIYVITVLDLENTSHFGNLHRGHISQASKTPTYKQIRN